MSLAPNPTEADLRTRLDRAAARLAAGFPAPTAATVPELEIGTLAEFPERGLIAGDDMTASLVVPIEGRHCAAAVLSLEPEAALLWIQRSSEGAQGDPLARFREIARAAIETLMGAVFEEPVRLGAGMLHEADIPSILHGTHAPADTALLSARLVWADESAAWGGVFYLLAEPKQLAAA
ncbi:MAG: hypothetical protein CL910_19995 [Deltaproteobacteria bacterium]|nr:hypothetical protein [Deltaproteobacteria bacterium]